MQSAASLRAAAIGAVALALAPVVAAVPTFADDQQLTPFRCFMQDDKVHVVFGPASFFQAPTVQGPTSFRENAGPTVVTFPLHHGARCGRPVQYVITDASDLSAAQVIGVKYVPKLEQAVGTAAVQNSTSAIGTGHGIDFPASVDFTPQHVILPGPTGFPPAAAAPGAVGEDGYSPLVQVNFRGENVVLNAPQVANATGQADKSFQSTTRTRSSITRKPTAATTTRACITPRLMRLTSVPLQLRTSPMRLRWLQRLRSAAQTRR